MDEKFHLITGPPDTLQIFVPMLYGKGDSAWVMKLGSK